MKFEKINFKILLIILINFVVRVPRMLYAHGLDGFLGIWEAKLIIDGIYFKNGVDFFDLLGLKPFSGYPIGSLLLFCLFLIITREHLMVTILLFDFLFTVIFTLSTFFLSQELNLKEDSSMLFCLLLTTLPNFLTFSYYSLSARLPFIAMLPIFFLFLLKFNKEKKVIYFISALYLGVILNFFHRVAIMLFLILFLSVTYFFLDKFRRKDYINKLHINDGVILKGKDEKSSRKSLIEIMTYIKKRSWVILILIFILVGFIIFGTDINKIIFQNKFNIYCYIKVITNSDFIYLVVQPIADQWIHFGLVFVISLLIVFALLLTKMDPLLDFFNKNKSGLLLIYYVLPFLIFYQIIYSIYFTSFIQVYLVSVFIPKIVKRKKQRLLVSASGILTSIFIILYHFLVTKVIIYFIVSIFILAFSLLLPIRSFIHLKKFRINQLLQNKRTMSFALFFIMLLTSVFIVDHHVKFVKNNSPITSQLTKEEFVLAEFLTENGMGVFDTYSEVLSTRLAALSGWIFISDLHNRGVFLLNNESIYDINCKPSTLRDWLSFDFIFCSESLNGRKIRSDLLMYDCYSPQALFILKAYDLRFFITYKFSNQSIIYNEKIINSLFIESLYYQNISIVKTTENFYVWNTSSIYC